MLASCESKWDLKGNMIYSDEKGDRLPGKRGVPEVLCGKEK